MSCRRQGKPEAGNLHGALRVAVLIVGVTADLGGMRVCDVKADEQIIPSITVSERYDTNVFNAAPEFIPLGTTQWDLVTTVWPQVQLLSNRQGVKTDFTAGVSGNTFVNNPELSFISTNASLYSDLDKLMSRFLRGARLTVEDYFEFTPQPPAFLTGVQVSQGVPDIFARGLQVARANSTTNTARARGAYAWSPTVGLLGEYSHSLFSIGQVFVTEGSTASPIAGLSTTTNAWAVGPGLRLSKGQSVSLKYHSARTDFSGGGEQEQSFSTRGIEAGYEKETGSLKVSFAGGGLIIEPAKRTYLTGSLTLRGQVDPSTAATVTLSRAITPSLFGTIGALISNTVGVSVEHRLERGLRLTGAVNYAVNESTPVKDTMFETVTGQVVLAYPLSRTLTTKLAYDYSRFTFSTSTGGIAGDFLVDKSALTLSAVFAWK